MTDNKPTILAVAGKGGVGKTSLSANLVRILTEAYPDKKILAIDAIAGGKKAAESIHRYVQGGHMTIGLNHWEFNELDKDDISVVDYDRAGRQDAGVDAAVPAKSFKDAHKVLTEEQVKAETARCLGCGATVVDANKCIGCGICTTKCAFDAITLHRDNPECSNMVVAEDKFKHIIPYQLKRMGKILIHKK